MEGIVFYDDAYGVVPLKSTISNKSLVTLCVLDSCIIGALKAISGLDPEGSDYPIHNEALMSMINSFCSSYKKRFVYDIFYKDYNHFSCIIEKQWENTPPEKQYPEYYCGIDRSFYVIPIRYLIPCLPQLRSMYRLWLHFCKVKQSSFYAVLDEQNVKVINDTLCKIVHVVYTLQRKGDVILARLNGKDVHTFELKFKDASFFVISMKEPKENTKITFFNFLEWGIDSAYDMLFKEKRRVAASKIIVEIKIKKEDTSV